MINDYSENNGTTGDSFTFNVSVVDNTDPPHNLTVNASWTHGASSGNTPLVHKGGNYFKGTIELDHNISDMVYNITATNTLGNTSSIGPVHVTVTDNDPPILDADNSPDTGTVGDSFVFDITASDNIAVCCVDVTWSHGLLSGQKKLSNDGDGTWSGSITLDNSISNLVYTIQINDTSSLFTISSEQIVTVTDDIPPSLDADNSPDTGTTGDPFYFDITASDNIEVGSVTISWSHGSLSGSEDLSNDGDGTWSGSIILGDSTDNLVYTVKVTDTSDLFFESSEQTVPVSDNDYPFSETNDITSYWQNGLDNPLIITATADDNNGLNSVSLYFYYSTDNVSFSAPTLFETDTDPWVDISWDFTFPEGNGYYRFYTIAVDNTSLTESPPITNDTICGYDTVIPSSEILDIAEFWINTNPLIINATGNDDISGLQNVALYYYNSTDNKTWNGPYLFDLDTTPSDGISWVFNFPNGKDQHYRFYSIATDNAENMESPPKVNDTKCFYGNFAPSKPAKPSGIADITVGGTGSYSTNSTDMNNDKIKYGWDWDGDLYIDEWTGYYDNGTVISTSHKWNSVGTYYIRVKARDEHGMNSPWSGTLKVIVTPPGGGDGDGDGDGDGGGGSNPIIEIKYKPVAKPSGPYRGYVNHNISFNGSKSFDVDGYIKKYSWDFGDGTNSRSKNPIHRYTKADLYFVTLTVTDNDGLTDSKTTLANITNYYKENKSDNQSDDNQKSDDQDPTDKYEMIPIEINGERYYLIDLDNDGVPNLFYNPTTGLITNIIVNSDGSYLIDIDGDGEWDYKHETTSETKTDETAEKSEKDSSWLSFVDDQMLPLMIGGIAVVFFTLILIYALFKIGYLYIEEDYVEKEIPKKKNNTGKKKRNTNKKKK